MNGRAIAQKLRLRSPIKAGHDEVPQRRPDESGDPSPAREGGLECHIHELVHFRHRVYVSGYAFHGDHPIVFLEYQLPGQLPAAVGNWKRLSPDLDELHGPAAAEARFDFEFVEADPALVKDIALIFTLDNGARLVLDDVAHEAMSHDPYHQLLGRFFADLGQMRNVSVLEIGSRDRSGVVRKGLVAQDSHYVGFDVLPGSNVDVVGDAHEISGRLEHGQFDVVFSISTFEHLAMPWKAAVEINRVMKPGGLILVSSHQTWPLHDEPWDFWRFSEHSWAALFNPFTGFEIVETASGEPASIVANVLHPPLESIAYAPARLASAVVCRKVGEPQVDWKVATSDILTTSYPLHTDSA